MGLIDTFKAEGCAVESICRVLREQGCQIAARTYRAWRATRQPADRTVSDAMVINAIFDASFSRYRCAARAGPRCPLGHAGHHGH